MSGAAIWRQTSIVIPSGKRIRLADLSLDYLREHSRPFRIVIPDGDNPRRQDLTMNEAAQGRAHWDLADFVSVTTRDGAIDSVDVGFWIEGDNRVRELALRHESSDVDFHLPLDLAAAKALFGEPSAVYEWRVWRGW